MKGLAKIIMDLKKILEIKNIGKEKLILLAVAGILLVGASYFENIKGDKKQIKNDNIVTKTDSDYQSLMEEKVKKLVENIKGVSQVSVVISYKSGGEKILQEDEENALSSSDDGENKKSSSNSTKKSTVIFSGDNGEEPYVVKELYPKVEGIAITGRGFLDETRKSQIINMLSALFDVPVHKISLLEVD